MNYFHRLRRPRIIVSPELFPLDEAIEVRPRDPGRICGAQGNPVKPEAPRPDQLVYTERSAPPASRTVLRGECVPPRVEASGAEEPALLASGFRSPVDSTGVPTPDLSTSEVSLPKGLARSGAKRSASRPTPSGPPDRGHHERKCRVCSHPDRDAIEEAFIHWHSPTLIAQHYQISDDSLYRHAYATGLDAVRSRNLRCALERILEKAQRVIPTADSIVRAARAYTRINDAGEWVEPPVHVIVSSGSAFPLAESRACLAGRRAAADHSSRPSNRGIRELENGSTR